MNDRAAWTAHITGKKAHKYGAQREGKYASKKEARIAALLHIMAEKKEIEDLREQVRFVLVPSRNGVRAVTYFADFTYVDDAQKLHVCDVKGFATPVYKLKKRMMYLILGITIEEL